MAGITLTNKQKAFAAGAFSLAVAGGGIILASAVGATAIKVSGAFMTIYGISGFIAANRTYRRDNQIPYMNQWLTETNELASQFLIKVVPILVITLLFHPILKSKNFRNKNFRMPVIIVIK